MLVKPANFSSDLERLKPFSMNQRPDGHIM